MFFCYVHILHIYVVYVTVKVLVLNNGDHVFLANRGTLNELSTFAKSSFEACVKSTKRVTVDYTTINVTKESQRALNIDVVKNDQIKVVGVE